MEHKTSDDVCAPD